MALPDGIQQREYSKFVANAAGDTAVRVVVDAVDTELGAVELKNGADDGRAIINDANTARVATDNVLLVQVIDEIGAVVAGGAPLYENDTYQMAQVSAPIPNMGTEDKWLYLNSTALEEDHVIAAEPCVLKSLYVEIDAAAATDIYYVQLFNLTAVPADATAVTYEVPVAINHTTGAPSSRSISWSGGGKPFTVGACVVISTTQFTKTETGDIGLFSVEYTA